jgi:hypothetical protein
MGCGINLNNQREPRLTDQERKAPGPGGVMLGGRGYGHAKVQHVSGNQHASGNQHKNGNQHTSENQHENGNQHTNENQHENGNQHTSENQQKNTESQKPHQKQKEEEKKWDNSKKEEPKQVQELPSRGIDVVHDEKIYYTYSVTFTDTSLKEIPFYTREFQTVTSYSYCRILLSIPFTSNDSPSSRNRLVLYLDEEPIYDTTMHNEAAWTLIPISIIATKINLTKGNHKITLKAAVSGGTLNIPHYNIGCIESTIDPAIFGRFTITGYQANRVTVNLDEQIHYSSSITYGGKTLEPIPYYSRFFTAPTNYELCQISLSIPFSGNDSDRSRTRLVYYLDDEPLYDTTMHGWARWTLIPITILATKANLSSGSHTLTLKAAVDTGTLNIPHYNTGCNEATISPPIFGKYSIVCFNKMGAQTPVRVQHDEKIHYSESILFSGNKLKEIPFYNREFWSEPASSICEIALSIPFTSNKAAGARNRIILYVDNEPIYDSTTHGMVEWTLVPINIITTIADLKKGKHTLSLKAAVDKDSLAIPWYDHNACEVKISPSIFGRLTVVLH